MNMTNRASVYLLSVSATRHGHAGMPEEADAEEDLPRCCAYHGVGTTERVLL